MKIAALQMCSSMQVNENVDAIAMAAQAAASQGVSYLQTPEMSVMFAEKRTQLDEWATDENIEHTLKALADIARNNALYLHIGSMAVPSGDGRLYNRAFLFSPNGELITTYDKIHLFDADVEGDAPYRESDNYRPGEEAIVTPVGDLNLGLSICYDVRFAHLYAALREAEANVMAVPAAFTVPTGEAHWHCLLRARAIETGSFVVAAAQGGTHENGRHTYGHSLIIDPWGRILAEKAGNEPGLIIAPLDLDLIKEARMRLPTLANRREFSLSVNRHMS
ncbi:carbon-nitrogen hydrolase family protein [Maritalea mediterranea]|uniref:Carbon-nitrogen hydrolase family protein n=1 Tax=Maritalea mediterranea TaxID=2909667 RepID=A0ABS9E9E3_9HYPH|nr:carbon-nitrogen hydrolase family protein [Maritalea mediterranea]MCF4099500.1 carbon-nitrogen hydrolase family protein [Maritalea mediterranea]